MRIGNPIFSNPSTPIPVKENPTAKASILVANAKINIVENRDGLKCGTSLSPLKYSRIIFPPNKARRKKAIQ